MKSLNEDLKTGQFKQIYLLYGSEGISEATVQGTACQSDDSGRRYDELCRTMKERNTDIKEVIDLAETLPFFASAPSYCV